MNKETALALFEVLTERRYRCGLTARFIPDATNEMPELLVEHLPDSYSIEVYSNDLRSKHLKELEDLAERFKVDLRLSFGHIHFHGRSLK